MTEAAEETYTGPRQATEAADMALELHGKMFAPHEDPPAEPATPAEPAPAEPAPADTPPAVAKDPAPAEPPAAPAEPEAVDWEARYRTLQGKYDAEVPRLHADLKEFKEQVFNRLGDPKATPVAQPQPSAEEAKRQERIEKFKEEYGEEYVGLLRDFMLSEVTPLLGTAVEPVRSQVASVEEAQQVAATENFVKYLDDNITDVNWKDAWEGKDPDFLTFLETKDPSGYYTYGQLCELANENWDGQRIVQIFNTYKDFKGIKPTVTPDPVPTPATVPAVPAAPAAATPETPAAPAARPPATPAAQVPNPAAEALVAPSRTTPHTTPAPEGEAIIWTQQSIRDFERADREGKYDSVQSQALWNDLLLAPSQNRIRG